MPGLRSNQDLPDSEDDKKHLQPDEAFLDLPDVEDIPGQEHIKVPKLKEFRDTTASSADEEGDGLFDDPRHEDELFSGNGRAGGGSLPADGNPATSVSPLEESLLEESASKAPGDKSEKEIEALALDCTDEDGEPLSEGDLLTDRFGEDLNLPESEQMNEEE